MKNPKQLDQSTGKFDASAWSGIGDATANEADKTQIASKITDDDDELSDEQKAAEADKSIDDDKKINDEGKEEFEFELAEEESKRIEDEIKKDNESLAEEALTKLSDEAKKTRLEELTKAENDSAAEELKSIEEELKKDTKNKDLKDEEITKLAEEKVKSDSENIFNSLDFGDTDTKENFNWTDAGKEISIDGQSLAVENNTQESFQEAINKEIDKIRGENESYSKLDPHVKDMVEFVSKNGFNGLEQWLHPDKRIESLLTMGDEKLVYEAVESLRKKNNEDFTKESVDSEIETMKDDGSYVTNVRDIRNSLRIQLDQARTLVVQRGKDAETKSQDSEKTVLDNLHKSIIGNLGDMKKFLDTYEIPDKVKKNMIKNITPEMIRRHQTDPNYLLESVIMRMFGTKLVKGMTNDAAQKSKDRSLRLRRNADEGLLVKKRIASSTSSAGAGESEDKKGFKSIND